MDDLMQNIRQELHGIFILGGASLEFGKTETYVIKKNTIIRFGVGAIFED